MLFLGRRGQTPLKVSEISSHFKTVENFIEFEHIWHEALGYIRRGMRKWTEAKRAPTSIEKEYVWGPMFVSSYSPATPNCYTYMCTYLCI